MKSGQVPRALLAIALLDTGTNRLLAEVDPGDFEVIAMVRSGLPSGGGDILPGMESDPWRFDIFRGTSMAADGTALFMGEGHVSFTQGLWSGTPSALRLIGRTGSPPPSPPEAAFIGLREPALDGTIATFLGGKAGDANSVAAIFSGALGTPMPERVRIGQAAPDGGLFEEFDPPSSLADGTVVFRAETDLQSGSMTDVGIFAATDTGITSLARRGWPAPDIPGSNINNVGRMISHPDGGVVYRASLTGGGPPAALFYDPVLPSSSPRCVVQLNEDLPGADGTIFWIGQYTLSGDGSVIFTAKNLGSQGGFFADGSIWRWRGGPLTRIVQGTDPAPGTPYEFASLTLSHTLYGNLCDDRDRVALLVNASDERMGIWFGDESGVRLVALEGETAPGGSTWSLIFSPNVGPSGHVGFHSIARTAQDERTEGIWIADPSGEVFKIVETGDRLNLRGQLRTVEDVRFNDGDDSHGYRENPINAAGQFVFTIVTEDGFTFLLRGTVTPEECLEPPGFTFADGVVSISTCSTIGYSYQLQYSEALDGWKDLGDPVYGTGAVLRFETTPPPAKRSQFFRVRMEAACP